MDIFAPFCPMPDQKQCEQGALNVVPKLLLSPVKIRDFDQKQPNLTQNWHFWSFRARPCQLIWCSVKNRLSSVNVCIQCLQEILVFAINSYLKKLK